MRATSICTHDASTTSASLGMKTVGAGGTLLLYQWTDAAALCAALAERGVRLRHGASFGLPEHIRIGVRPAPEQERLVAIWRELDHRELDREEPLRRRRSGLTLTG